MEFKVGDRVKRKEKFKEENWAWYCKKDFDPEKNPDGTFEVMEIRGISIALKDNTDGYFYSALKFDLVEETDNKIPNAKMTKKSVYNVLVVNKKTGNIEVDKTVVADGEKSAILRAYDIDVEKLSFTVTERAEFEEEKPQTVVLQKEAK